MLTYIKQLSLDAMFYTGICKEKATIILVTCETEVIVPRTESAFSRINHNGTRGLTLLARATYEMLTLSKNALAACTLNP